MKERPILMSAPMVRACLDGSKTQTRRVVKPGNLGGANLPSRQPTPNWNSVSYGPGIWSDDAGFSSRCPYGVPGDRLWVRECWAYNPDFGQNLNFVCYRADPGHEYDGLRWRPSIHMPRKACRIVLEVTGVRVERLQDISEADARAEGVRQMRDGSGCWVSREGPANLVTPWLTAREAYADLWNVINGASAWDANPWVWVIEFKRVKP
jgi:hypothetical protein